MLRSVLLAAALVALSPLASHAQYGGRYADRARAEQRPQRQSPPPRHRDAYRENDQRNRLSPEEQRELNRDLRRADREIYRKGKEQPRRN